MSVQTDVLSAHRTTTGEMLAHRTRVKSIVITTGASAGSIVLRDGGASGAVKVTIVTPAVASMSDVSLPGEGVLFATDVHLTATNVTGVTVFYG